MDKPPHISSASKPSLEVLGRADSIAGSDTYLVEDTVATVQLHDGVRIPFTIEQADGIFGLLLLSFLFFAHIYNGGFSFLKENLGLLFSFDKGQRLYSQTTAKEVIYSYFLIFQSVVLVSVCAYDIFIDYYPAENGMQNPLLVILMFMIVISLFIGAKNLLYRIVGYIFDEEKQIAIWRRTHTTLIEVLGILYFIPTLFLLYANVYSLGIIIFMFILFVLVQITLFYQIIIFFIREKFNFLYWIAYLCTFEILPYIFMAKGLKYLYRIDVLNII